MFTHQLDGQLGVQVHDTAGVHASGTRSISPSQKFAHVFSKTNQKKNIKKVQFLHIYNL